MKKIHINKPVFSNLKYIKIKISFFTGQRGRRSVTKRDVSKRVTRRGMNIGIIDKNTGQLVKEARFDTHGIRTASKDLAAYIKGIPGDHGKGS